MVGGHYHLYTVAVAVITPAAGVVIASAGATTTHALLLLPPLLVVIVRCCCWPYIIVGLHHSWLQLWLVVGCIVH
jgi:hypothetical protein